MTDQIHETVRAHYARAAIEVLQGGACCGESTQFGKELYSALERDELPDKAVLASLGCGNPTAVADLHEGERVLDLGSGGGIDVLLSAKRVGPTGRAYGLDMTDEMLALARRNAVEAGATNVEWVKGTREAIPLPADSIDAGDFGLVALMMAPCIPSPTRWVEVTDTSVRPTSRSPVSNSENESAPAMQPQYEPRSARWSGVRESSATMSVMPIRPPGRRTRAISRKTERLSTARLMTQLLMTTSTDAAGSGIASI